MTCQSYIYSSQTILLAFSIFNTLSLVSSQVCKYTDQEIFNRAKIVQIEKPHERFDSCFTYAVTYHLGIVGQASKLLKINAASDLIEPLNVLNNYYKKINFPCKDSLVVYKQHSTKKITHFGIIQEVYTPLCKCIVISKWGFARHILEHKLFEVPKSYGTKISFFILKSEYKKNRSLFLKNLNDHIAELPSIQRKIKENEIILLQIANQENKTHTTELLYTAHRLLKECMGLSINTFNPKTKRTVLMLATKRNNLNLIHLFLSMGADKAKTDINGNTALMIAQQNNFTDAIKLLECDDINLLTQ